MENDKLKELSWLESNILAIAHTVPVLLDPEEDDELDLNIRATALLTSVSGESVETVDKSRAAERGQSYYHPGNLAPPLFLEPQLFIRPSNTLGLWKRLTRDEDVSDLTEQDPAE